MPWNAFWGSHMLLAEDLNEPDPYRLGQLALPYASSAMTLATCTTSKALRLEIPHTSAHVFVCMPLTGQCRGVINGVERQGSAITALIISPGMQVSLRLGAGATVRLLRLDVGVINRALEAELGHSPSMQVRFAATAELENAAALRWVYAMQLLDIELRQEKTILDTGLGESSLAHLFGAALLCWVQSNYQGELQGDLRGSAARRAAAYIDAHLPSPLLMEDIAHAAMVSVRTLQHTFKEELGTTVSSYIRAARLERIREDLLRCQSPPNIGELGTKWGIPHAGRLSSWYKERFGETPSQTLEHRSRHA